MNFKKNWGSGGGAGGGGRQTEVCAPGAKNPRYASALMVFIYLVPQFLSHLVLNRMPMQFNSVRPVLDHIIIMILACLLEAFYSVPRSSGQCYSRVILSRLYG